MCFFLLHEEGAATAESRVKYCMDVTSMKTKNDIKTFVQNNFALCEELVQ